MAMPYMMCSVQFTQFAFLVIELMRFCAKLENSAATKLRLLFTTGTHTSDSVQQRLTTIHCVCLNAHISTLFSGSPPVQCSSTYLKMFEPICAAPIHFACTNKYSVITICIVLLCVPLCSECWLTQLIHIRVAPNSISATKLWSIQIGHKSNYSERDFVPWNRTFGGSVTKNSRGHFAMTTLIIIVV